MKRHAKAASTGSTERQATGLGRFFCAVPATRAPSGEARGSGAPSIRRLALLLTAAAALLLVPASQAFAEGTTTVNITGTGSGEVIDGPGEAAASGGEGTPPLACTYVSPGPATGVCTDEPEHTGPGVTAGMRALAAPGSEFTGWTIQKGTDQLTYCEHWQETLSYEEWVEINGGVACYVTAEGSNGEIEVTATFTSTGPPSFKLNLSATGTGSGSFECKVEGGAEEPCAAEYEEGKEVEVVDHPATGSEFVRWEEDCTGTGPCVLTMGEEHSVKAVNDLEKRSLLIEEPGNGEGTVTVECNGGSCPPLTEIPYGTSVKVSASASTGSTLGALSGEHSASGCASSPCEFTLTENSEVSIPFSLETFELTVNESGPGSVAVQCDGGSCASLAAIPYGTEVEVTPTPTGAHDELTEFKGTGSASGCEAEGSPCTFEIEADSSVTAAFALETVPLTVNITGQATKQCEDVTEAGGLGGCAATYPYGHTIEVVVTAETNWELEALSGEGSAAGQCSHTAPSGSCTFAIEEASTVDATAEPAAGTAELTVYKGGNGEGTVDSISPASPTIDCGPACEEESAVYSIGETVTLEQTAVAPGSVFSNWSGCHHISATECTVKITAGGNDVAAVFIAVPVIEGFSGAQGTCAEGGVKVQYAGGTTYVCNGVKGVNGETPTVTPFAGDEHGCHHGGIDVELEGNHTYVCNGETGATGAAGETPTITPFAGDEHGCHHGGVDILLGGNHTYVCNGETGATGATGASGASPVITPFAGEQHGCKHGGLDVAVESTHTYVCNGETGATGGTGPQGEKGATGSQGPQGNSGSQGSAGAAGPEGKQGPQGPAGKVTVTCKVKGSKVTCTVNQQRSKKRHHLRWRLMSGGHVQSQGTGDGALRLDLGHLKPGRYVLSVEGQRTTIVVPAQGQDGSRRHG